MSTLLFRNRGVRSVAQRGVQSLPIVIVLDELLDVRSQMFQVIVFASLDFFPLQRLHEAFAAGIVIRVRRTTHARNHPTLLEEVHVFCTGVLPSAVRVMH